MLRKPFKLRENAGNYILWTGDPNNATIKIDAEYLAENVRFSDLDLNQFIGFGTDGRINDNVRKYRGPILVVATLSDKLMAPDIAFRIELPERSQLKNDPDALRVLSQGLIVRELNEQFDN